MNQWPFDVRMFDVSLRTSDIQPVRAAIAGFCQRSDADGRRLGICRGARERFSPLPRGFSAVGFSAGAGSRRRKHDVASAGGRPELRGLRRDHDP